MPKKKTKKRSAPYKGKRKADGNTQTDLLKELFQAAV